MSNSALVTAGSIGAIARQEGKSLAESFLSAEAIVVVDMSGSMSAMDAPGNKSRYDAAEGELRQLQQTMPGKIAVVAFSDSVKFCPGGIPERMGGGTDMAAALRFVLPADGVARIILISDGDPNDREETLNVARRFTGKIDTVYIGPESGMYAQGREFLAKLAAATGGQSVKGAAPGMFKTETMNLLTAGAR